MPENKSKKNTESLFSIGFDMGGTKMLASVIDAKGEIVGSKRAPTKGHEGAVMGLRRVQDIIEDAMKKAGITAKQLLCIGVACPGIVNYHTGTLLEAANLGWDNVPVAKSLRRHFGCPVSVMNDVDAGTYGEYIAGAGVGARTLLGVFPGTGIGGGCIYDGHLIRGKNLSCMEIGNIHNITSGTEPQRMEERCGRLAVASAAAVEAYRGRAPHLMKNYGTDLALIKSKAISDSIDAGDQAVATVLRNAIAHLGVTIAGVVDLLCPDVIVMGGGLVEKMPDAYVKGVSKAVRTYATAAFRHEVKIVPAKLGDNAVIFGVAAYARKALDTSTKVD